jgi:hypothetical protein
MIATVAGICSVLAFIAFVVLAILTNRSHSRFLSRLRDQHLEVWTRIQDVPMSPDDTQPSVVSESSRYVSKRRYLELPDPELHRLGDRSRSLGAGLPYLCVAIIVFGCLAAVFAK